MYQHNSDRISTDHAELWEIELIKLYLRKKRMKSKKKLKKSIPEVHIQGDLEDVKKLVNVVSKKKSVVIFRNGNEGTCYAEIEKIMVPYSLRDITRLEKDFRIIYFDFFPLNKPVQKEPEKKTTEAKPLTVKHKTVKAKAVNKTSPVKPHPGNRTSKGKK